MCFALVAATLTWLVRDHLFHPVEARCLSGHWVEGRSTRRGFAFLHLRYEWGGKTYDGYRTFGPLDDSSRVLQTPDDIQRGRDWIVANCRDQYAFVMHGLPSIAWFRDQRGWNSVIAAVILRAIALAAAFSVAAVLFRRRRNLLSA